MTEFDCIVAGAGPAGLAAACLLAQDGRRTALVAARSDASDPRTVALMRPSIRMLEHLDLWPGVLDELVQPLRRLRLVDDTGTVFSSPSITFDPDEIGEVAFGWNVPLSLLIPVLDARAKALGVEVVAENAVGASTAVQHVTVTTTGGRKITTRVVLAADGRNSIMRDCAGIKTNTWSYDQVAVTARFLHSGPHDGVSTEYHKGAGPLTTVPLPGFASSLVWMERAPRAAEIMALTDDQLAREIQLQIHGDLGLVGEIGPRRAFPMQGLVAREFAKGRVMLIGEAAHVVPPIGAQGLNMSLRDAAQAAELIALEDDPGHASVLSQYDMLRRRDVQPRLLIIDLMNRSLLSGYFMLEGSRALGLSVIAGFGPLRRYVMTQGLAPVTSLPRVMRAKGKIPVLIK